MSAEYISSPNSSPKSEAPCQEQPSNQKEELSSHERELVSFINKKVFIRIRTRKKFISAEAILKEVTLGKCIVQIGRKTVEVSSELVSINPEKHTFRKLGIEHYYSEAKKNK